MDEGEFSLLSARAVDIATGQAITGNEKLPCNSRRKQFHLFIQDVYLGIGDWTANGNGGADWSALRMG